MNYHIRKAQEADAASLAELLAALGRFNHIESETESEALNRTKQHLKQCLADESHSIFTAVSPAGELLGYCAVHWLPYLILAGPEGYVSELFIAEAARGQGIGGELLENVKAEAKVRGCSRLSLLNRRQRDSYQRGFYSKHGWEERPDMVNFIYMLE